MRKERRSFMRKLLTVLFAAAMFMPLSVMAARENIDTLFGDVEEPIWNGVYASYAARMTVLDKQGHYSSGWRVMWMIDDQAFVGPSFNFIPVALKQPVNRVYFQYHGGEIGYQFESDGLVHAGIKSFFGPGFIRIENPGATKAVVSNDQCFVIEPMFYAEVNMNKWFRMTLGAGYRMVWGTDSPSVNDNTFRGIVGDIELKVGLW